MNRTLAVILLSASCLWACPKGSEPYRDGVCVADIKPEGASPDESAKWVSEEKPPRHPQPDWEIGKERIMLINPVNPADEHHPKDCSVNCFWDGGTCNCDSDSGKLPK